MTTWVCRVKEGDVCRQEKIVRCSSLIYYCAVNWIRVEYESKLIMREWVII